MAMLDPNLLLLHTFTTYLPIRCVKNLFSVAHPASGARHQLF